jgi:hypothetical protein
VDVADVTPEEHREDLGVTDGAFREGRVVELIERRGLAPPVVEIVVGQRPASSRMSRRILARTSAGSRNSAAGDGPASTASIDSTATDAAGRT